MRRLTVFGIAIGAVVCAAEVFAAQNPSPAAFTVYYQCDPSREERADEIAERVFAPIMDTHVAAGRLSAWGWLEHRAGGHWRRAVYFVAPNRNILLDMVDEIILEMQERNAKDLKELSSICHTHDDYIWTTVAASQPESELGQSRPPAAVAAYFECEISREDRADSLVARTFAPVLERQIEAGTLWSWSWLSHSVGGKWRRLLIYDGADHKTILNTRDQIIDELARDHAVAVKEFGEICASHQDYLWNIAIARP